MDDFELEAELRGLTPRRVSPRLAAAFSAVPSGDRGHRADRIVEWRRWTSWCCAAGLLFGLTSLSVRRPAAPPAASTTLIPAAVETVVLDDGDEGLVSLPDGSTARRYRIRSANIVTWKDPSSKASVRWIVPREDVRIEPVHFH